MKTKFLFLVIIILSSFSKISAQSHYMHEAAEDNEGGPLSGITGLLLIIGIVYVLDKIGQKENDD